MATIPASAHELPEGSAVLGGHFSKALGQWAINVRITDDVEKDSAYGCDFYKGGTVMASYHGWRRTTVETVYVSYPLVGAGWDLDSVVCYAI